MDALEAKVTVYMAYLEDLGRIGSRHETIRQFYISVISALFVFLTMAGKDGVLQVGRADVLVLVGIVGIIICVAWFLHMFAFGTLFAAKKKALEALEAGLESTPFATEKEHLGKFRLRLTIIDRCVAFAFLVLFVVLICMTEGILC